MTSAVLATGGACSGCTDDCTLLEVTTTGLLGIGIGALPTGGASIAAAVVVLVSFSGFSAAGDDSMTCFDEFLFSEELFLISSFSTWNLGLNTDLLETGALPIGGASIAAVVLVSFSGGGCEPEIGLLFSLSLLLLLLPKIFSLEVRLVYTADFRASSRI